METEKNYQEPQECPQQEITTEDELTKSQCVDVEEPTATTEDDKVADPVEVLTAQLVALNDSHLRLMAEYDNYRKRTLKEKSDLIRNGGEKVLTELLPVIDDFERALENITETSDAAAVKEGVELIYTKFMDYLQRQGVRRIETAEQPFDADLCEAIAVIPAPTEAQKGMIVDCVKSGYTLNEKVIRHAHVVVGE